MNNSPFNVSVVINNYNYGRFLAAAIESALRQTHPAFEVIVVDDGSSDDSLAVARRYEKQIHLLVQTNGGQGSAYNTGYAAARGDWVIFLDSDDLLAVDALEIFRSRANLGLSALFGRLQYMGEGSATRRVTVPSPSYRVRSARAELTRFGIYVCPPGSGFCYRRSFLANVMPMPVKPWRICADTYPILQAPFHGGVEEINSIVGYYRRHGGAATYVAKKGEVVARACRELERVEERRVFARSLVKYYEGLDARFWWTPAELKLIVIAAVSGRLSIGKLDWTQIVYSILAVMVWPRYKVAERIKVLAFVVGVPLLPPSDLRMKCIERSLS